ncbi:MAG: hypothetical protein GOVbin406_49 [Prokaryotic dsDNA virus sp.]|nr:MAG: hypothetical protein GOVbin406_49 [Prokaryotic dsDNA virus sp.]|tara:strand:- start:7051 stop:7911 length:861 start_codon:yes stop_codon:yes gene_type:complete
MSFCTINGIDIPIADASAKRDIDIYGRYDRGPTGGANPSFCKTKRAWTLTTPPLPKDEYLVYRGLVDGDGLSIQCQNNLYASDGTPARGNATDTVSFNHMINSEDTLPMQFDGGLYWAEFGSILADSWYWETGYSDVQPWTILWITNNSSYEGSDLFCKTGNGPFADAVGYRNGTTVSGAASGLLNVGILPGDQVLKIYNNISSFSYHKMYKEIVLLPYRLTEEQRISATTRTKRWSLVPQLRLSGDMVEGETVDVFGVSGDTSFVRVANASSPIYNTLSFTLQEK